MAYYKYELTQNNQYIQEFDFYCFTGLLGFYSECIGYYEMQPELKLISKNDYQRYTRRLQSLIDDKTKGLEKNDKIAWSEKENFFLYDELHDEFWRMANLRERKKNYDLKYFFKLWSKLFFDKNYEFTIKDIEEIVKWCCSEIELMRKSYRYTKLIPFDTIGYINQVALGLGINIAYNRTIVR